MKTKKYHAHTRYRLAPTKSYPKGELVPGVTTIVSCEACGRLGCPQCFIEDEGDWYCCEDCLEAHTQTEE